MAGPPCFWVPEGWHFVVKRGHHGERILRTDDDGRRFLRGLSGLPEAIVVGLQTCFPHVSASLRLSGRPSPN